MRPRMCVLPLLLVMPLGRGSAQRADARIAGTIHDSLRGRPLDSALVFVRTANDAQSFSAVTDRSGHFSIDTLPAGKYVVTFSHAILDSLDLFAPEREVNVAPRSRTEMAFYIPSGTTIRAMSCPGVPVAADAGALRGRVTTGADERPVRGARVLLEWNDGRGALSARGGDNLVRVAAVDADTLGNYRFCGLPTGVVLSVQASTARDSSSVVDVSIPRDAGLAILNLPVDAAHRTPAAPASPASRGKSSVRGRVENVAHEPVVRARVTVLGQEGVSVTNSRGEFYLSNLNSGRFLAEVLAVGYAPGRPVVVLGDSTSLINVTLAHRVIELDSMRVIASRPNPMERARDRIGEEEFLKPEIIGGSALDAIEWLRPEYFNAAAPGTLSGKPARRGSTGSTDKRVGANFQVSIDEASPVAIDNLELIPARTIREMRWMRPTDATARFGVTANMMPVLVIYTLNPGR